MLKRPFSLFKKSECILCLYFKWRRGRGTLEVFGGARGQQVNALLYVFRTNFEVFQ